MQKTVQMRHRTRGAPPRLDLSSRRSASTRNAYASCFIGQCHGAVFAVSLGFAGGRSMSNALAAAFECEISDDTLIERVLAGNTQLFAVLVRRYNQRLFRVARAIVTNDADAEDALQQTYLAAFRKLGTFEGRSRVSTWLIRIAIREALDRKSTRLNSS